MGNIQSRAIEKTGEAVDCWDCRRGVEEETICVHGAGFCVRVGD